MPNMAKIKIIGVITIVIVVLLATTYYVYLDHINYYPTLSDINKNPSAFEGKIVQVNGYPVNIKESGFDIRNNMEIVHVISNADTIAKLSTSQLKVTGVFKNGKIIQSNIFFFKNSFAMYWLSFLGFVIFLIIFFYDWKLKPDLPLFEERKKNA